MSISAIKPPAAGQVVYKDAGSPLQLRVSAGGSKTFYVVVGQGRRHTIGRFGEVTLAQARDVARRIRAEKTLGKYQRHSITWEAAREKYLAHTKEQTRPKTYREYERILMLYFPFSGNLHDITKHEIVQRLTGIAAPSQRDHALVILRVSSGGSSHEATSILTRPLGSKRQNHHRALDCSRTRKLNVPGKQHASRPTSIR